MTALRFKRGYTDAVVEWLLQAAKPITPTGGILLGAAIIGAIAATDIALGPKVQLTAMYVFGPIATAWCATRRDAVLVALLATMASTAVHLATGSLVVQPFPLLATLLLRFLAAAGIAVLVAEVRALTERYEALSLRDGLTSLLNRRALVEQLGAEIERARRHSIPLALIYADIDFFKEVNDQYGHAKGDEFLRGIADVFDRTLRPTDIAARMGGDEFVVVLPETDETGALALAARLSVALETLERQYGTGLSMGVAAFATAPESAEAALRVADDRMYEAKRSLQSARLESAEATGVAPAPASRQSPT